MAWLADTKAYRSDSTVAPPVPARIRTRTSQSYNAFARPQRPPHPGLIAKQRSRFWKMLQRCRNLFSQQSRRRHTTL
eukprot:4821600-Alexandrium_andersonii.AAC.1